MLEPFQSFFSLRWTNEPFFAPLPSQITRNLIPASSTEEWKKVELLSSQPQIPSSSLPSQHDSSSRKPPAILFLHGGFGSAPMYADFMTYLSKTYNAPTYALSCRGRGASYPLCYLNLVYRTGLDELANDVVTAIDHIHNLPDQKATDTSGLILVGHSSGGGLLQYALARKIIKPGQVSGIVLLDAIPNFGNISVYANWAALDPWFSVRMSFAHFNHVASPLSTDKLIKNAFFGKQFAIIDQSQSQSQAKSRDGPKGETRLQQFKKLLAPYESLLWPLGMMKGWWSWLRGEGGKWLDVKDILSGMINIHDSDENPEPSFNHNQHQRQEKVCIIIGSEDKLMDIPNQRRMATQYRTGIRNLITDGKVNWRCLDTNVKKAVEHESEHEIKSKVESESDTETPGVKATGIEIENSDGVRFVIVNGAGHHVQNDIMWMEAVEQIRQFALRV